MTNDEIEWEYIASYICLPFYSGFYPVFSFCYRKAKVFNSNMITNIIGVNYLLCMCFFVLTFWFVVPGTIFYLMHSSRVRDDRWKQRCHVHSRTLNRTFLSHLLLSEKWHIHTYARVICMYACVYIRYSHLITVRDWIWHLFIIIQTSSSSYKIILVYTIHIYIQKYIFILVYSVNKVTFISNKIIIIILITIICMANMSQQREHYIILIS